MHEKKEKSILLIVDDSILIIERLLLILEDIKDVVLMHALNYAEAYEMLETLQPKIVLLDINLPDRSGMELLPIIRKKNEDTKIVIITNHGNEYYRSLCKKLGAHHFIDKSKDFDLIHDLIAAETVTAH